MFQKTGQLKAVTETKVAGDLFPGADPPSAEEQRVHHSAASKREGGQTGSNSQNERIESHGDQHERDDIDCEARCARRQGRRRNLQYIVVVPPLLKTS